MRYIFLSCVGDLSNHTSANHVSSMVLRPRWWLHVEDHVSWKVFEVYIVSRGRHSQYDQDNDSSFVEILAVR